MTKVNVWANDEQAVFRSRVFGERKHRNEQLLHRRQRQVKHKLMQPVVFERRTDLVMPDTSEPVVLLYGGLRL